MSDPAQRQTIFPAVVTAGGRISGDFAVRAGTDVKALVPIDGVPVLARVIAALRAAPSVGRIVVVGPAAVETVARASGADLILPEAKTGPENMLLGLAAVQGGLNEGHALLCATDAACLDRTALESLTKGNAVSNADIVFPVVTRAAYEERFPQSPNTWARVAGQELTGSSVQLVRPAALERNHHLLENVFNARKSQWQMARLLGLGFALKFFLGTLTIAAAEARASALTGCACRARMDADPRLALDIDTLADYEYVLSIASSEERQALPLIGTGQRR